MKKLVLTKFFRTLREASQTGIDADADTLQKEYDDFAGLVFSEGIAATDIMQTKRALNFVLTTKSKISNRITDKKMFRERSERKNLPKTSATACAKAKRYMWTV